VVWSAGETIEAAAVAKAFALAGSEGAALNRDSGPTSELGRKLLLGLVVVVLVLLSMAVLSRCTDDPRSRCAAVQSDYGADSLEYSQCLAQNRSAGSSGGIRSGRTGGGSYGGWSSGGGGGHK
jgi:uncharacterized membrane protein YgcG